MVPGRAVGIVVVLVMSGVVAVMADAEGAASAGKLATVVHEKAGRTDEFVVQRRKYREGRLLAREVGAR